MNFADLEVGWGERAKVTYLPVGIKEPKLQA